MPIALHPLMKRIVANVLLIRFPRWLRGLIVVASVGYLVVLFVLGLHDLGQVDWHLYLRATVVGLGLYPLSLAAQATSWALATGFLRRGAVSFDWSDVRVYATSYLLRRLPGGIWQVAGRIASYHDLGVQAKTPVTASAIELGLLVLTAGGTYFCFGILQGVSLVGRTVAAFVVAVFLGCGVGALVARVTSPSLSRNVYSAGTISHAMIAGLYLFALAVASTILFVYVRAGGAEGFLIVNAVTVWALVAAAGTLAGLLPATMGLREVTLAIILVGYVNRPSAVIIAVLFRLLFIAGDLLWGGVLALFASRYMIRETTLR